MRTTKELHAIIGLPITEQHAKHLSSEGWRAYQLSDIQEIIDESVAHGMTLASEITQKSEHQDEDAWMISDPIKGDILIARDKKVWRKG